MEQLTILLTPFLVFLLAGSIKKFKLIEVLRKGVKKPLLRIIVIGLSFGAVLGEAALKGNEVDPVSVEVFVQAAMVFLTSTGGYYLTKNKKDKKLKIEEEEVEEEFAIPIKRIKRYRKSK